MADRRLTPARADLAAAHLKGVVDAPRFSDGEKFSVCVGRASLRVRPAEDAAQDSELLFGETFTVYDRADGWAWGQAADDLYVWAGCEFADFREIRGIVRKEWGLPRDRHLVTAYWRRDAHGDDESAEE